MTLVAKIFYGSLLLSSTFSVAANADRRTWQAKEKALLLALDWITDGADVSRSSNQAQENSDDDDSMEEDGERNINGGNGVEVNEETTQRNNEGDTGVDRRDNDGAGINDPGSDNGIGISEEGGRNRGENNEGGHQMIPEEELEGEQIITTGNTSNSRSSENSLTRAESRPLNDNNNNNISRNREAVQVREEISFGVGDEVLFEDVFEGKWILCKVMASSRGMYKIQYQETGDVV